MIWTPEIALLVDATSIRLNDEAVSRLRQRIRPELNWGEVLRIAIPHGVLPLLIRNMTTYAADLVPPPMLAQLRRFSEKAARHSQRQCQELASLIAIFHREGIRALPFKGPALAVAAYGDAELRESHDLDLWVELERLARSGECLRAAGYLPTTHLRGIAVPTPDAGPEQREFSSSDGQVLIELRGHLESSEFASGCRPEFEEIWSRHGWTDVGGEEVPGFAAEDLLPALAVHASKHMWRRLNWIVDIAAVISTNPLLDWDLTLRRARRMGCGRRLLVACALARELYGVELPSTILTPARGRSVRALVTRILASLFQEEAPRSVRSFSSEIVYQLQICESAAMRLKIAQRSLRRAVQANEGQIFPPMSGDLSRMYRAVAALRRLIR
jgi:hypothetical protein